MHRIARAVGVIAAGLSIGLCGAAGAGSDGGGEFVYMDAKVMAEHCRFSEAVALLERHPDVIEGDRDALLLLASLYTQPQIGEGKKALDRLANRQLLEVQPYYWMVRAGAEDAVGSFGEAQASIQRAISLGVDKSLAEGLLGEVYLNHGDLDGAERHLLVALSLDPKLTGALYNLGIVRARENRVAEAAALVRQSWEMGERDSELLRKDPDLDGVRRRHLLDDLTKSPRGLDQCQSF